MEEMREDLDEEPDDVEYFSGCLPMRIQASSSHATSDTSRIRTSIEALQRVRRAEEIEEVVVTGLRGSMAVREKLADYQLYRLPERNRPQGAPEQAGRLPAKAAT